MAEVAEVQFPHPLAAVEHHDGVCTGSPTSTLSQRTQNNGYEPPGELEGKCSSKAAFIFTLTGLQFFLFHLDIGYVFTLGCCHVVYVFASCCSMGTFVARPVFLRCSKTSLSNKIVFCLFSSGISLHLVWSYGLFTGVSGFVFHPGCLLYCYLVMATINVFVRAGGLWM